MFLHRKNQSSQSTVGIRKRFVATCALVPRTDKATVLAAIDVGTNAVRLKLARPLPDGSLETLHDERDPVRPGEGVFKSGQIPRDVADRLLSTLRRYGALCRRYKARVRAVATSAVREAGNRDEILKRVKEEAGLNLELVSGREEARLICLGVLQGRPPSARSLVVDIGGGSTEVASALGEKPIALWSVAIGAVRLTEMFDTGGKIRPKDLKLVRSYVREAVEESLPEKVAGAPRTALGSSGSIHAVVQFAAAEGTGHVNARQLTKAVEELVDMGPEGRRKRFDPRRADIIVPGAVILEAIVEHLRLTSVVAVDRGLRDGILADLMHRLPSDDGHSSLVAAALAMGKRFDFDEHHAGQVTTLALRLFDELASLHNLPAATRPLLEVAGILHDIGNAVNYQRHHKHTQYLIQNGDIPGLADRQRELVARIARYHRGNPPEKSHSGMEGLSPNEANTVRKLATLLRVADALDRSHHQPVRGIVARDAGRTVTVRLRTKAPVDLELWDAQHEAALFRQVFGRKLALVVQRN
jgi:exopolyphosphatase / guanosine-5'-triphosphate,3'-diphosphate pyrophosphatase